MTFHVETQRNALDTLDTRKVGRQTIETNVNVGT